jgi:hypothetical protein
VALVGGNLASRTKLLCHNGPCRRVSGAPPRFRVLSRTTTPPATFSGRERPRPGVRPWAGNLRVWVIPRGPRPAFGPQPAHIRDKGNHNKPASGSHTRLGRAPLKWPGQPGPSSAPRPPTAATVRLRVRATLLWLLRGRGASRRPRRRRGGGVSLPHTTGALTSDLLSQSRISLQR